MERQRLERIRQEGRVYGYGLEEGRRKATSDYYERKREETERKRDPSGARRLVYGSSRAPKYHELELDPNGLLGTPQKRKKKKG